jgi:hypothetical protein
MATRNRKTQRRNRNRNRSRRNKVHRGGAISCSNAATILADPTSSMVKKMAAKVQAKQCNSESAAQANAQAVQKTQNTIHGATSLGVVKNSGTLIMPNKRHYNYRAREGAYAKCNSGQTNKNGKCIGSSTPVPYVP